MSAQAAVPAPPSNWWSRNWKWFVPTGCLTLILLFSLFLALIFTFTLRRWVTQADEARVGPVWGKVVGAVSITLWTTVTVGARLIGLLS